MAAGDIVQVGTVLETGLMGFAYSNLFLTVVNGPKREADQSDSKDGTHASTQTKFFKNPRRTISLSGLIPASDANDTEYKWALALKPGDIVALDTDTTAGLTAALRVDEKWRVVSVDAFDHGETQGDGVRFGFTAVREDSMATAYDA